MKRLFYVFIFFTLTSVICNADIWIGQDDALTRFDENGNEIVQYRDYRYPASLSLDKSRDRLWFIDRYDYTIYCINTSDGSLIYEINDALTKPETGVHSSDMYYSDGNEPAPFISISDNDGSVWIADRYGHQIVKFDVDGEETTRKSGFREPRIINADSITGGAWVTSGESQLIKIDGNGERVETIKKISETRSIAVSTATRNVYIAEYGNNVVRVISDSGKRISVFDTVEQPIGIFVNDDGTIWVISEYEYAYLLSSDGDVISKYDRFEKPLQISGNGDGTVWILDGGESKAYKLDIEGNEVADTLNLQNPSSIVVQ